MQHRLFVMRTMLRKYKGAPAMQPLHMCPAAHSAADEGAGGSSTPQRRVDASNAAHADAATARTQKR
jgi:hypothetical protein